MGGGPTEPRLRRMEMKYMRILAVLAVVVALMTGSLGSAFAKGPPDENPGKGQEKQEQKQEQGKKQGFFGNVTEANEGNVTFTTKQDWTVTLTLTETTRYKIPSVTRGWADFEEFVEGLGGNITALEGMRIAVSATGVVEDPEGMFEGEASKLSVVPPPGERPRLHAHRTGIVTAFDEGEEGSITISDVHGVDHEFQLMSGNATVYRPQGALASDIVVEESFVTVVTTGDPKLGPPAKAIVIHPAIPEGWLEEKDGDGGEDE
jgi:hypothetical protein